MRSPWVWFASPAIAFASLLSAFAADVSLASKPEDKRPVPSLPVQNEPYPAGIKADPFIELAPPVVPTAAEKASGMVLFSRPLTEPVWAETNPLPHERVTELTGWGARDQFVTLNFAVYGLQELKDLHVTFRGNAEPELRVVRYWDIIYPRYSSFVLEPKNKRFRRMPEFLAPFTAGTFPAKEPQRFLLTFRLPSDGTKEIKGDVFVWHSGFAKALRLPVSVKVLPFTLKQAPNKHFNAYHTPLRDEGIDFYRTHKEDKALVHRVAVDEYRRMKEIGFTRPPVFSMSLSRLPDGTRDAYWVAHFDEYLAELKEAGIPLDGELLLSESSYMALYREMTGLPLKFHMLDIQCDKIPEALYERVEKALDRFLAYTAKKNYPRFIFNPVDEPCPAAFPYAKRLFEIYHRKGLKTFLTSPPERFRQEAGHLIDVYNFGSFRVPYEVATSGKKAEYWCYPNDNAFQYKDPNVMCHGGRMTFGYGYWRSGFQGLVPWTWRRTSTKRLGCYGGNLLLEDGRLFLTTYWECFRLGVDDLRYLYTLEDAVVKREHSADPACRKAVAEARALLQRTWNAICPQNAYLRMNLMHHLELDGRRAELANAICTLSAFPESDPGAVAPSVIIDPKGKYMPQVLSGGPNLVEIPLKKWRPIAKELTMKEIPGGLDLTVKVDHNFDGEPSGKRKTPVGWPRIQANFRKGLDLNCFSALEFDLSVHSDRDAENDYVWPLVAAVKSGKKTGSFRFCTTLEPDVKHHVRIPVSAFESLGHDALSQVNALQIVIHEAQFPDRITLKLKLENLRLIGSKAPSVTEINVPEVLALPAQGFSVPVKVSGVKPGDAVTAHCSLLEPKGKMVEKTDFPVLQNRVFCGFSGKDLTPGKYSVKVVLTDADGTVTSEQSREFSVIAGPALRPTE